MNFAVILPALNAEAYFSDFLPALEAQTIRPKRFIVIDSSSTDNTVALAKQAGAETILITRSEFNHGRTRMLGVNLVALDCDIAVFLTQDAILANPHAIETLLRAFDNPAIDVAYGRQLPREQADAIETFARTFNYPGISENRSKADIARIGFMTCFLSNSFAAYRISRLIEFGGFPDNCILGEDTLTVAKMILLGSVIRYEADAQVYHSHGYTLMEEARRYFDIGVMHEHSRSLLDQYGLATSAGKTYIKAELTWLLRSRPICIPEMLLRTLIKYIAYKVGRWERVLPLTWKKQFSMHHTYWDQYHH